MLCIYCYCCQAFVLFPMFSQDNAHCLFYASLKIVNDLSSRRFLRLFCLLFHFIYGSNIYWGWEEIECRVDYCKWGRWLKYTCVSVFNVSLQAITGVNLKSHTEDYSNKCQHICFAQKLLSVMSFYTYSSRMTSGDTSDSWAKTKRWIHESSCKQRTLQFSPWQAQV